MPLLRTSASDVTNYLRVNATSLTPVAPNLRRPGTYAYTPRQVIPPITRASVAGKGASPGNTVLKTYGGPSSPAPSPPVVVGPFGGSLYFDTFYDPSSNPVSAWLRIEQTTLSPGTGDFTISWWQYLDTNGYKEFPRAFCLGDDTLQVSFEGPGGERDLLVWVNGTSYSMGLVVIDASWAHVAVVRKDGVLTAYVNGIAEPDTHTVTENITTTGDLFIGARTNVSVDQEELFEGYMTNFCWITGYAVYTENFTPPMGNIDAVPGTQLLLLANSKSTYLDNSAGTVTINNSGVFWDNNVPT